MSALSPRTHSRTDVYLNVMPSSAICALGHFQIITRRLVKIAQGQYSEYSTLVLVIDLACVVVLRDTTP